MKFIKVLGVCIAAIAASCTCVCINANASTTGCDMVYQAENDVWVHNEMSAESENVGLVHCGEIVKVYDIDNGWALVEFVDSNNGIVIGYTDINYYEPLLLDDDYSFIEIPEDVSASYDKEMTYSWLAGELMLNKAATDAAMINIYNESGCNAEAGSIDINGLESYGICQWNGPRFEALKEYCSINGFDYTTVEAQLKYLRYEFETTYAKQYAELLSTENSIDGSYNASYYWASKFEVCSSTYWDARAQQSSDYYQSH